MALIVLTAYGINPLKMPMATKLSERAWRDRWLNSRELQVCKKSSKLSNTYLFFTLAVFRDGTRE